MLNPDNVIPCLDYHAENDNDDPTSKDGFLNFLWDELEEFKSVSDVWFLCWEKFNIQAKLKTSKLI